LGDVGEIYNLGKVNASNGNTITYQLSIPLTANLGDTKVRIISEAFNYPTYSCSVFDQGQAEDYTFTILKETLAVTETDKKLVQLFSRILPKIWLISKMIKALKKLKSLI
jgi:hypothetical protein